VVLEIINALTCVAVILCLIRPGTQDTEADASDPGSPKQHPEARVSHPAQPPQGLP
jgi:hypothetical protein